MLQVKERLLKVLTFWADRKLYDKDTMQQLEAALLSGDPNAMLQAPAPKQVRSTGHAQACHAGVADTQIPCISLLCRQRGYSSCTVLYCRPVLYCTVLSSCTGMLCPQMHLYTGIEWTWAVA